MRGLMKRLLLSLVMALSVRAFAHLVYLPKDFDPATARMVVAIHGCLQSAESMSLGSGWNLLADEHNLVILYPQIRANTHPQDCWPYWKPENQQRGTGELEMIRTSALEWKEKLGIPNAPVYLNGLSSGAAMVAALLACYPEEFSAGVLHSGVPYGLARSQEEALRVQRKGPTAARATPLPCDPKKYRGSVIVIQGERDRFVNPKNADRILFDFFGFTDETTTVRNENGRTFQVKDLRKGGALVGRSVSVRGLAHAWSGCAENLRHASQRPWSWAALPIRLVNFGEYATLQVPFFSPKGPSATRMAYEFFDETAHLNGPSE